MSCTRCRHSPQWTWSPARSRCTPKRSAPDCFRSCKTGLPCSPASKEGIFSDLKNQFFYLLILFLLILFLFLLILFLFLLILFLFLLILFLFLLILFLFLLILFLFLIIFFNYYFVFLINFYPKYYSFIFFSINFYLSVQVQSFSTSKCPNKREERSCQSYSSPRL